MSKCKDVLKTISKLEKQLKDIGYYHSCDDALHTIYHGVKDHCVDELPSSASTTYEI